MKLKYLNIYDTFDTIWAEDKASISTKLDATKLAMANRKRLFQSNLAFLIVFAISSIAFIARSADWLTVVGNVLLICMVLTMVFTSRRSYKDAAAEVEYYTKVLQAYDNDVMLSIVAQAVALTGERYGITITNSPAVLTRLLKNKIAMSNVVVDKGCRKMFLELDNEKVTIPVSDVKDGELNCITILHNGVFISNMDNVNKSNVKETYDIDLDVTLAESSVEDIANGIVPTV